MTKSQGGDVMDTSRALVSILIRLYVALHGDKVKPPEFAPKCSQSSRE